MEFAAVGGCAGTKPQPFPRGTVPAPLPAQRGVPGVPRAQHGVPMAQHGLPGVPRAQRGVPGIPRAQRRALPGTRCCLAWPLGRSRNEEATILLGKNQPISTVVLPVLLKEPTLPASCGRGSQGHGLVLDLG